MRQIFLFLPLCFTLLSCGSRNHKEVSGLWHLPQVCIDISTAQLSYYRIFDVYEEAGNTFLLGHNTSSSSLDLFSISDRAFISTFVLDTEGPVGIQDVVGLKVVQPGIVWVATLTDFVSYDYLEGNVLVRYPLASLNDQYSLAKYAYFFDNHGELVALNDSTVIIQGGYFPLYNGQSSLHLAVLNVNSGAITDLPIGLPRWLNGAHHFGGLSTLHYGVSKNELYYNFPFSDSLYRYDISNDDALPARQLNSPLLPSVLAAYQGDASIESIVQHSSASDFYMGFRHLDGEPDVKYRFSIAANEDPQKPYTTHLELYKGGNLLATEALCTWCKTRTFTIKDTIHIFREGAEEGQLCFEKFIY